MSINIMNCGGRLIVTDPHRERYICMHTYIRVYIYMYLCMFI
jgi:hypothetical protein